MSEYASIKINNLSLWVFRNYLKKEIVELFFNKQDLRSTPDYCEDPEDEDSVPYTRYVYQTKVGNAKDRLDVMGYGLNHFEKLFNEKTAEAIDYNEFLSYLHIDYNDREEKARTRIKKYVTFKKWTNSMNKIIKYELEHGNIKYYRGTKSFASSTECDKIIYHALMGSDSDSYYAISVDIINIAFVFRLILESCDNDDDIILDFSYLDFWNDDCIPKALEAAGNAEKTIVLVEGTSDKDIIEFALQHIYPHLTDLFYFMDFSDNQGSKRCGGTSDIRKCMETFYYSRLRSKFIAVFDNDAVGYQNKCLLVDQIKKWPENFCIQCYPEIVSFKHYPTLAPNGSIIFDDINRKACSIELYLPDSIVKEDGEYIPIEWENRVKIKRADGTVEYLYQGVISKKDYIKKEFHEMRQKVDKGEHPFLTDEWDRMRKLLDEIVFAYR